MYVFDICDTLYYSNTTFDFILFVIRKDRKKFRLLLYKFFNTKFSPLFVLFHLYFKFSGTDVNKKYTLKLLSGYSKVKLYGFGRQFINEFLDSKKIELTHQLLHKVKNDHEKIYLLSASIDPVVNAISEKFEVDFFSSRLTYKQEIFKGEQEFEMSGKKLEILKKECSNFENLTVVTDNFSDRELMTQAKNRIAVIYDNNAEEFWKKLSPKPKFIDLRKSK